MHKTKTYYFVFSVLLVCLSMSAAAAAEKQQASFKVGFIGSFSGSA